MRPARKMTPAECIGRINLVYQIVLYPCLFFCSRLGTSDIHILIELHGVTGNHFAIAGKEIATHGLELKVYTFALFGHFSPIVALNGHRVEGLTEDGKSKHYKHPLDEGVASFYFIFREFHL